MTKSSVITSINDHNGRTDNLLFSALPKIDVFTLNLLDNGLSARYLLNEWMDFDQACTAVLLRQRQEQIRFFFFLPRSHFQGYTRAMILENGLSAPYLIEEWMNFDQT